MTNYEVSDLLQNKGKTIRNNSEFLFPLTHEDSAKGVWFLLQGVAVSTGGAVTYQVTGSIDGISTFTNIGTAVTLTGTFANELEIAPAAGSTLRPFLRVKFTIPATSSLVFSTFKRTKRT